MPRTRARLEKRLLKEQDPVGIQRAERREQEELASKKKIEAGALTKAQREMKMQEREAGVGDRPERIARPGKPLKRAR